MSNQAFETKLSELAHLPAAELQQQTPIEPEAWDSVEILELIALMDEAYGVTVPMTELNRCRTVGELRSLIGRATAADKS